MKRVELYLDSTEQQENNLLTKLFQYGRYLLLASSRANSKLPAHLQGIWNDNVACRIGWTCDLHLDINTQMNYWPAEVTAISEVVQPLFKWIEEDLLPAGRKTARESYRLPGWVAELVSNAWGFAAPYWAVPLAPCPTAGIWILSHLWEHYLYSRDEFFLRKRAYPIIEEAVEFFLEYLFEDGKGNLIGGPSISPENSFLIGGKAYQISNGCTYEIIMIRELFNIFLQAAELIGDSNISLVKAVREKRARLLPYHMTSDGRIAEWYQKVKEVDCQHRHSSHLLGLFPFAQITVQKTSELATAAELSIERKVNPVENWEDTGWASSLLALYEARLQHGEKALAHLQGMLKNLLAENHFVFHPPTRGARSFDKVYELDGNTGLTAAIAEMLMQSQQGIIILLPALPAAWKNGFVKGLVARGNIKVDIFWQAGKLSKAIFCSEKNISCKISYKGQQSQLKLYRNKPFQFNKQEL